LQIDVPRQAPTATAAGRWVATGIDWSGMVLCRNTLSKYIADPKPQWSILIVNGPQTLKTFKNIKKNNGQKMCAKK